MRMTTTKLIALRLYNITFGRSDFFGRLLKDALVRIMVLRPKRSYVATSRFFDPRELEG
jgi:hypothetical protein